MLTIDSLKLALLFGLLGALFSTNVWIEFLDSLSPGKGLIVYYTLIYISVYLLSLTGLVIGHSRIENPIHTLGVVMILFSFFIIFNWESEYINIITRKEYNRSKVSEIYLQSEDGATFDFFYKLTNNLDWSRILTFIITPIILTFIGGLLITGHVKLGM